MCHVETRRRRVVYRVEASERGSAQGAVGCCDGDTKSFSALAILISCHVGNGVDINVCCPLSDEVMSA
jgi:hypothetical protein